MNSSFPCKFWRNFFLQDNNPCRGISPSKSIDGSLPQRDSLFTFGIPQPRFSHKATLDNLIPPKKKTVWYFPSKVERCHFFVKENNQESPSRLTDDSPAESVNGSLHPEDSS